MISKGGKIPGGIVPKAKVRKKHFHNASQLKRVTLSEAFMVNMTVKDMRNMDAQSGGTKEKISILDNWKIKGVIIVYAQSEGEQIPEVFMLKY